jgi:hypothetical protein
MHKRFLYAAVAVLATLPFTAHAEFKDGNGLLADIQSDSVVNRMVALGYVIGVADAVRGLMYCPPGNVTAGQLVDVTKLWLLTNPAQRTLTGDVVVQVALGIAWPCPKSPSRKDNI